MGTRTLGTLGGSKHVRFFSLPRFGGGPERHGPERYQVAQAGMVAVMTLAAAALLVTQHALPGNVAPALKAPHVAAAVSTGSNSLPSDKTVTTVIRPR